MATFSYAYLSDYAKNQLLGFATANRLRQSVRYLAEDILRDPASNGNILKRLDFNNAPTDGGGVSFDGGSTKYMKAEASGLALGGVGLSVASPNIIRGDRLAAMLVGSETATDVATQGSIALTKAGSFLSFSIAVRCTNFSSNETLTVHLRKNESNVTNLAVSITGTGLYTNYTTFTRDTFTFAQGDRCDFFMDGSVAGTWSLVCSFVEFIFDS
jgi:hypothetical protein